MKIKRRFKKLPALIMGMLLGVLLLPGIASAESKTVIHNRTIFLSNAEGSPAQSTTFSSPARIPLNAVISKVRIEINGKRNGGTTSDTYLRVSVNNTAQTFAFGYEQASTIGKDYMSVSGLTSSFDVQVNGYGYLRPVLGLPPLITGTTIYSVKVIVTYSALYTVTWKSGDVILETDRNLPYLTLPSYDGAIPTRAEDAQYIYHAFIGWEPAVAPVEEDTTYQADYDKTVKGYTVTWKNGDAVLETDLDVSYGTTPEYNGPAPVRESTSQYFYTFSGWEPAVGTVTGTAAYEAVFIRENQVYTITFDSAGGSAIAGITQGYGTAVSAPDDPAREGHTFQGWSPAVPAAMPSGDLTCTAQWQAIPYTITFDSAAGSPVAPISTDYGTAIILPPPPVRTGYTFDGWTPELPQMMPAYDLSCTAMWLRNMYSVHYLPGAQGTFPIYFQYIYYNAAIPPVGFSITGNPGYVFDGWEPALPAKMPGFNTVHTARWIEEGNLGSAHGGSAYTITFDSAGGSPVKAITADAGTPLTAPSDAGTPLTAPSQPKRRGFAFVGWEPAIPPVMPENDLTCIAQWAPKVTYYPDNTLCAQGLRLRDITPELTDNWQMFTPLDLSRDGEQTIPLIASNLYYAGEAKVLVRDGTVSVSYTVLRGISVKSEFLAILPDLASAVTTDPAGLQEYGFNFRQPVSIKDDLGGDTRVILYIMNVVDYNDAVLGLRLFTDRNPLYREAIEAFSEIMD